MKNTKRIIALLAAMAMVLPLAACSETTSEETQQTAQAGTAETAGEEVSEENARLPLGVAETADFGGQTINFLVWTLSSWQNTVRDYRDVFSEGLNGEGINDAVYNRNLKLQENYKVTITEEKMELGQIATTVDKEISAGTNTYSVVYPRLLEAASMYQKNYFHNLLTLDNIDLTQPWWDGNSVESLSMNGKLLSVASSINVNDKDATAALAFNKDIAKNNGLEDIYTLVREGKWTYDKAAELADMCDYDANGDGKLSEDDVFGFLGKNDVMTAFWFGAGSNMVTKEDDMFVFSFGTERDITSATRVVEFMNQPWFYNHHTAGIDDDAYRVLFETGHGLIFWMRLDEVTNMRAGDADFGIIPTPKFEEAQDNYYSFVSQHTTGLMSLPITLVGDELNAVTTVLEAMAWESHYTLIPEYIESSLKTKHSRDAESADMLDIIINNRVFDPMIIYNFGGFADNFQMLGANNNTNLASFIKSTQKVVAKTIEKFVKNMTEQE